MDGGGFGELRNEKKYLESSGNTKEKKGRKWKWDLATKAAWKVGSIQQELEPNEELGKLLQMRQGVEKADDARDWTVSIDPLPTRILR